MKYVIFALSDASKLDFSGADKLTKTDHLICVYAKGKKTISDDLKETFDSLKPEIEFWEAAETADIWMNIAYLIGYYVGAGKDTYAVLKDKSKLPSKVTKEASVYTSFKSVGGSSSSSSSSKKSSSTKKSSTTKKTTTKKSTSSTKKSSTKKSSKESDELDLGELIGGLASVAGSLFGGDSKK